MKTPLITLLFVLLSQLALGQVVINGGTTSSPASTTISFGSSAPADFGVSYSTKRVLSTGSTSGTTSVYDALVTTTTGQGYVYDYRLYCYPNPLVAVSWSSTNPSVATVDSSGNVAYVADGSVSIRAAFNATGVAQQASIPLTMVYQTGTTTKSVGWNTGTLAKAMQDGLDALLTSSPTSSLQELYTSISLNLGSPASSIVTRNTACIVNSITGITSPAVRIKNQGNWTTVGATLIASDIAVSAHHTNIQAGAQLLFLNRLNQIKVATVVAVWNAGATVGLGDVDLLCLDGPVDSSIEKATLLPSNWVNYIGVFKNHVDSTIYGLPVIRFTQQTGSSTDRLITIGFWNNYALGDTTNSINLDNGFVCTNTNEVPWRTPSPRAGDSGNANYAVVAGNLVLLTGFYSVYTGPDYSKITNAMIDSTRSAGHTANASYGNQTDYPARLSMTGYTTF